MSTYTCSEWETDRRSHPHTCNLFLISISVFLRPPRIDWLTDWLSWAECSTLDSSVLPTLLSELGVHNIYGACPKSSTSFSVAEILHGIAIIVVLRLSLVLAIKVLTVSQCVCVCVCTTTICWLLSPFCCCCFCWLGKRGLVFLRYVSVCLSVCPSVCLSVSSAKWKWRKRRRKKLVEEATRERRNAEV